MKGALVALVGSVAAWSQLAIGGWGASAPAAPRLFNEGLWRGATAGADVAVTLRAPSPLFDVPIEFAVGGEHVFPTTRSAALEGDYRGWIGKLSLVWLADDRGVVPYLRLGGGISLGERCVRQDEYDPSSPLHWRQRRSFVAFWGIGVRGSIASALQAYAELELLSGDEVGLLLPLRLGLRYCISGGDR